jgi:hypothetical protein
MLRTEVPLHTNVRIQLPEHNDGRDEHDVVGELLSAFFKLGALQLRLGIITIEAMLTFGGRANQTIGALDKAMPSAISEEEIEAACHWASWAEIAG